MSNYFHVLVKRLSEKKQLLFKDLSEKELGKSFIKPFQKGKNILVNGTIYKIDSIENVQIIRTKNVFKKELKFFSETQNRARDRANLEQDVKFMPYAPREIDITSCGEDVTSNYINSAPRTTESFMQKIIYNPWIIGIGVTIIAAIIIWLISKYTGLAL